MTSIWDFSASQPSNNSAIPAGFPSGANPSSVKTEFQYLMAFLAEGVHSIQATGTTEAFTASLTNVPASLTDGMQVAVRALGQNTTSTASFGLSTYSAHTITKLGGTALVSGDIAGANHELLLRYNLANTRWELLNPAIVPAGNFSLSPITSSLGSDVTLNNTANYFDGPSVAQGSTGTWFASGTVTVQDTSGASTFDAKLWDGTTVIASLQSISSSTAPISISLSGYIASPAGNLRISVRDAGSTSGKMVFNASGNSKDCTISALRVA